MGCCFHCGFTRLGECSEVKQSPSALGASAWKLLLQRHPKKIDQRFLVEFREKLVDSSTPTEAFGVVYAVVGGLPAGYCDAGLCLL
jgi:hypothetical protein